MGRSGIRRRKRYRADEPGVIEDLHDQAEWSSYTQDVPRIGDEYREGIRLARIRRAASAFSRGNTLGDYQWTAIAVTLGLSAAVAGGIWAIVALIRLLTS